MDLNGYAGDIKFLCGESHILYVGESHILYTGESHILIISESSIHYAGEFHILYARNLQLGDKEIVHQEFSV